PLFLVLPPPPGSTLFPYTTLFRSRRSKQALLDALGAPTDGELRAQFHELWWRLVGFARAQPLAFAFLELHHHGSYLDEREGEGRSEEHTSELQSQSNLVCRLLLEK